MSVSSSQPFDHVRFRKQVEKALYELASNRDEEGRIDRAWLLACGAMQVHACVDERTDGSHDEALSQAWYDLWLCFADEVKDHVYWGIYEELCYACRPHDMDALDAKVTAIGAACLHDPDLPPSPSKTATGRTTHAPWLSLVE